MQRRQVLFLHFSRNVRRHSGARNPKQEEGLTRPEHLYDQVHLPVDVGLAYVLKKGHANQSRATCHCRAWREPPTGAPSARASKVVPKNVTIPVAGRRRPGEKQDQTRVLPSSRLLDSRLHKLPQTVQPKGDPRQSGRPPLLPSMLGLCNVAAGDIMPSGGNRGTTF